jgi:hypothetical protein
MTITSVQISDSKSWSRHINQKYHHFWEWVKNGFIESLSIDTTEQPVNLLTKPLDVLSFLKHCQSIAKLRWVANCCLPLPNKGV